MSRQSLIATEDRKGLYYAKGLFVVSLFFYVLISPVSSSINHFPLGTLVLAALYMTATAEPPFAVSPHMKRLAVLWGLLVGWQYLTIFLQGATLSPVPLLKTFYILPLFLASLPFKKEETERLILSALLLLLTASAIIIAMGFLQKILGITYLMPKQPFVNGQLVGFLKHHNIMAEYLSLLCLLALCLCLFWKGPQQVKIILWGLFSILCAGVILTMSRTYYIALTLTILLILFKKGRKSAVIGGGILTAFVVLMLIIPSPVKERAHSITDTQKDESNIARLNIWRVGEGMVQEHPITGIGYNAWREEFRNYAQRHTPDWKGSNEIFDHAHNAYLHAAAETGIAGLILFLAFWCYFTGVLFRKATDSADNSLVRALALSAAFGVINLFIGGIFEVSFTHDPPMLLISCFSFLSFFAGKAEKKS